MKTRNIYFDNAKSILIFLVVLGHFANLNTSHSIIGGLNNIIYSFHMPMFIFISGYFSKNINRQRKTEIDKILYLYVVFEIINESTPTTPSQKKTIKNSPTKTKNIIQNVK